MAEKESSRKPVCSPQSSEVGSWRVRKGRVGIRCLEMTGQYEGFCVEEYRNEYLDGLVGQVALVKLLTGPPVDDDLLDRFEEDPLTWKVEHLHSRTSLRILEGYDRLGVVQRPPTEDPKVFPFSYRGAR